MKQNDSRPMTDDEMAAISKSENAQRVAVNSIARNDTAQQAYDRNLAEVRRQISRITRAVNEHAEAQAVRPKDWGFVGDLSSLNDELDGILSTLCPEPELHESEGR